MSAIARYFISRGIVVAGYDRTQTELTEQLCKEGALVHYEDNVELIPVQCRNKENTLVVYTPAIPSDHCELTFFREQCFVIQKRAQVLGTLTRTLKGLCVAGTHGKTTTSSMAAHLLHQSHVDCNAFLGGITKNYRTNYILSSSSPYVVIEADEFDRSFHWLTPFASVITATDADHLDIYGDKEQVLESFRQFVDKTMSDGVVIYNKDLPLVTDRKCLTYGFEDADVMARDIRIEDGMTKFSVVTKEGLEFGEYKMQLFGKHNVMNALSAIMTCFQLQVDMKTVREGLAAFQGVQRRFDIRFKNERACYIDDYAHHPNEISAAISSTRERYPDFRYTAIFQPHLYTRTRDFAPEFAEALSKVDRLVLLDIYPARELPIPGVTSEIIFDAVTAPVKVLMRKEELLDWMKEQTLEGKELFMTLGAGDIDRLVGPLAEMLTEKHRKGNA